MPKQERIKTKYPGVYFVEVKKAGQEERIYYIRYRCHGKVVEEKAGFQSADDMTAAKANQIRASRIKGELSNTEKRKQAEVAKQAEADKMTITRLWDEYRANKTDYKGIVSDTNRFDKHIRPKFGNKETHEIDKLDTDRLRLSILKDHAPKTARNVFELLCRIVNYGVEEQKCKPMDFKLTKIKVDNQRTEDLNPEQLKRLLEVIDESTDVEAKAIMRLALYTGMRRGEMFKLKWNDIDFQRGFIAIKNPKGGVSQKIPLNEQARHVLENHPRTAENVFVRLDGKPFTDIRKRVNKIKEAAGIPADFRALHGLRHTYASMLASSGKVDLYTLQKLLTHKSPVMTQRYAHLRDESLRNASTLAGNIIDQAISSNAQEAENA